MLYNKYNIIYADPPWTYKDNMHAGRRGAIYKHACMELMDIRALHVNEICDKDAALFLWCTAPQLHAGLDVIGAWGFTFKTVAFTWIKRNKKSPTLFWGGGHYTRSNPEYCLLGVKGKLNRVSAGVHSVVHTPVEEPMKKPDIVRARIVELYGDIPRIELFARKETAGWDVHGDEVKGRALNV